MEKTILIAEDEQSLLMALTSKLQHEGYRVLQAKDGKEGLEIALAQHPDLLLLDIAMPKMDGLTMLDKLREDNWGKEAKVIVLTNFDADDEKLATIVQDQPAYYLVKSTVTLEEIVETVKNTLDGSE